MFELTPVNVGIGLVVLALLWVGQLGLSSMQYNRFYGRVRQLRKLGAATSVGFSGNIYSRRTYAVLVIDEDERVVAGEKLSGFTVFATLKPVPEVVGLHLNDFEADEPKVEVNKKVWKAFQKARQYILEDRERKAAKAERELAQENGSEDDEMAA